MKKLLLTILFKFTVLAASGQSETTFARPALFETAFLNDPKLTDSTALGGFLKIRLGSLKIESGKLIITDPVQLHHAPTIPYTFPIGDFPVEVAINYTDSSELGYVSYSRIVFSIKKVSKWVLLVNASKDSAFRKQLNYSAWTESCAILDINANRAILKRSYMEWAKFFIDSLNNNNSFPKWKIHKFGTHNLVAYSGFDINSYKVYLGLDAGGKIARLLIDGGMFFLPPSSY
jgi:hypothetical protein